MEIGNEPVDEESCPLVKMISNTAALATNFPDEVSDADRAQSWLTGAVRGRVLEMRERQEPQT
jgi:hypothetical protein